MSRFWTALLYFLFPDERDHISHDESRIYLQRPGDGTVRELVTDDDDAKPPRTS